MATKLKGKKPTPQPVAPVVPTATIKVEADPLASGIVAGGGTYPVGSPVLISAAPATGWEFIMWTDHNALPSRTVTVPVNSATYVARFREVATVTVVAGPNGMIKGGPGTVTWPIGHRVTAEAVPNSGFQFAGWSDGNVDNPRKIVVLRGGLNLTANFAAVQTQPAPQPVTPPPPRPVAPTPQPYQLLGTVIGAVLLIALIFLVGGWGIALWEKASTSTPPTPVSSSVATAPAVVSERLAPSPVAPASVVASESPAPVPTSRSVPPGAITTTVVCSDGKSYTFIVNVDGSWEMAPTFQPDQQLFGNPAVTAAIAEQVRKTGYLKETTSWSREITTIPPTPKSSSSASSADKSASSAEADKPAKKHRPRKVVHEEKEEPEVVVIHDRPVPTPTPQPVASTIYRQTYTSYAEPVYEAPQTYTAPSTYYAGYATQPTCEVEYIYQPTYYAGYNGGYAGYSRGYGNYRQNYGGRNYGGGYHQRWNGGGRRRCYPQPIRTNPGIGRGHGGGSSSPGIGTGHPGIGTGHGGSGGGIGSGHAGIGSGHH
jgi:hypothetical protein